MNLDDWGWNDYFQEKFQIYKKQGLIAGRIIKESRHIYEAVTESGKLSTQVSGHYMYKALNKSEYPTIGDWVSIKESEQMGIIENLVPRKSAFSRKSAGDELVEQVIAANIDYIFLVFALDGGRNFSAGAIERFLTRAWDSGANPVILLNKSDMCENSEDYFYEAQSLASGAPVYLTSAKTSEGLQELDQYLLKGKTIAFTGFSGVGKSALINRISGTELMKTGTLRENDQKGRHTTTTKELVKLDSGVLLIDSPGIKELQLWGNEESLNNSFQEISQLAEICKFNNCTHSGEPGCAVQEALVTGELDHRRFENYLTMQKELKFLERKNDKRSQLEEKQKGKNQSKLIRNMKK